MQCQCYTQDCQRCQRKSIIQQGYDIRFCWQHQNCDDNHQSLSACQKFHQVPSTSPSPSPLSNQRSQKKVSWGSDADFAMPYSPQKPRPKTQEPRTRKRVRWGSDY